MLSRCGGWPAFPDAAAYAESSYAAAQKAGDEIAINQSLLTRARIYRDQHDLARSDDMLAEVEPRLRRDLPPGHYAFGSLASERSLNALAKGDIPAAIQLADQAVAIDEASIKARGEGAVPLRLLLIRRSTIELAAHRPNDAAADAARALSLLQAATEPGTFSSTMGIAYLALANIARGPWGSTTKLVPLLAWPRNSSKMHSGLIIRKPGAPVSSQNQRPNLDKPPQRRGNPGLKELGYVPLPGLPSEKLTPLLRLKYSNSISDAIADLGEAEEINKAFVGFQKYLYQPEGAMDR